VDIESSSHVILQGQQILCTASCTAPLVKVNGGGSNIIIGNNFLVSGSVSGGALSVIGSSQNSITSNVATGPVTWGTNVFSFTSTSLNNVISSNVISGTATNGILIDSSSTGQIGLETDNIIGSGPTGTLTNLLNDASRNGTTIAPNLQVGAAGDPSSGILTLNAYKAPAGQTYCLQVDQNGSVTNTGGPCGAGGGGGSVTSFSAPSVSWPTWLVPTVTSSTTTPQLTVAASAIPNSALASPWTSFTFSTNTTSVAAGTCVAQTGVTVSGAATTSTFTQPNPTTTLSGVTGWGSGGTLRIQIEPPTSNTFNYDICNDDPGAAHTPGSSVTWRAAWF
jgi:hypothetical protein